MNKWTIGWGVAALGLLVINAQVYGSGQPTGGLVLLWFLLVPAASILTAVLAARVRFQPVDKEEHRRPEMVRAASALGMASLGLVFTLFWQAVLGTGEAIPGGAWVAALLAVTVPLGLVAAGALLIRRAADKALSSL